MAEPAKHIASATASIGTRPYRAMIRTGQHELVADEPKALGGNGDGPAPFELLLSALGACTAITLRMYAEKKGWPLEGLDVSLTINRVGQDLKIERSVTLRGALGGEERENLADIVERTPVTLAIKQGVPVATRFTPADKTKS